MHTRQTRRSWVAQLQFFQGKELKINFNKPIASGNFGSVFYGSLPDGTQVVVKCPVLDEFSLKLFDTERAVNIKLSQQTGALSVPWATMLGEVNIPEPIPIAADLARIGIVWEKEGAGITLEEYLANGKDLYGVLQCRETPLQAKTGNLRPELCRNVMGQMLIALLQMQEKGIMHRDVKPSNTLIVPNDPEHQIKIIDFGSSCDWGDPLKRGLGDATCDPMYAPPEQTLQLLSPGKFDVFSVGMIGFRVLFPSLTRGGVNYDWPGGFFQQFAEEFLPEYDWDVKRWITETADTGKGQIRKECKEAVEEPEIVELMNLIYKLLDKSTGKRLTVQQAISALGPEWAERAKKEVRYKKDAELQQKALEDQTRREAEQQSEQDIRLRAAQEKEEGLKRKNAEDKAIRASKAEEQRLRQLLASGTNTEREAAMGTVRKQRGKWGVVGGVLKPLRGIFGGFLGGFFGGVPKSAPPPPMPLPDSSELGDDDIANIVPQTWAQGRDFYRDRQFMFKVEEIVVAFRSDGSRRYGRILQDYGDNSYDILVDRFGGEGAGQFRTDSSSSIGKIATTASLLDELAANFASVDRTERFKRAQEMVAAQVGDAAPAFWKDSNDFNFSATSSFKNGEMVMVARTETGNLTWGKVQKFQNDGLYEVLVEAGGKRMFFPASLGKILA